MKYYSISIKKSELCRINVKLINGDYSYLNALEKKNILNKEVIDGCLKFPERINNNKALMEIDDLSI